MKRKREILIAAGVLLLVAGLSALLLWWRNQNTAYEGHEGISIVILDSGSYYYSDKGIDGGLKMAIEDVEKELGIPIQIETVDDEGDYVKGIALAKSLAENPAVDIVISFQNFESIGPEVPLFEEAKKPFISTMGCYDEVAENEYKYFLADFMSGKSIGKQIGNYLVEKGAKNIALCHSDTTFERDEIRGIQSVVKDSDHTAIVCAQTGPFQNTELSELLVQCEQLHVDTVVANFYNQKDSAWLLEQLGQKAPELMLVGDYALNSEEILKKYGKNLENVTIIPSYPCQQSERLDAFCARYVSETGQNYTPAAVQYYDLIRMLAKYWKETNGNVGQLMSLTRQEEGYSGEGGQICFDNKGCLTVGDCPVYECRNSAFVLVKEK